MFGISKLLQKITTMVNYVVNHCICVVYEQNDVGCQKKAANIIENAIYLYNVKLPMNSRSSSSPFNFMMYQ